MRPLSRRRLLSRSLELCAGAGLITGLGACRQSAAASHERNRVAFEAPPVEAALWFVDRYFDYVASGEEGLRSWLAGLEPAEREFVLAMAQTLLWTWIEHERPRLVGASPAALAREAIVVVRGKTLNQLEVPFEADPRLAALEDLPPGSAFRNDPVFAAGSFARLVRGASNCEGQNHLALLLLEDALRIQSREGEAQSTEGASLALVGLDCGHEIVEVRGPALAQPLYVDAWSNLPPFVLEAAPPVTDAVDLAALRAAPTVVVPELASRAPLAAKHYATAQSSGPIPMLPAHDAPARAVDLSIRAPSLEAVADPKRAFVFARVLQLFDDPRAAALYERVLADACPGRWLPGTYLCQGSALLRAR